MLNLYASNKSGNDITAEDKEQWDHLLSLLPEEDRHIGDSIINIPWLKIYVFKVLNKSKDGAMFKSYKKINGSWHKVKKDGSLHNYGLSRPMPDIEDDYIMSLPDYEKYALGDGYFM